MTENEKEFRRRTQEWLDQGQNKPMTETEKEFRNRLQNQLNQGLAGVDFVWGDLNGATAETIMAELNSIDRAIEAGNFKPIPDDL